MHYTPERTIQIFQPSRQFLGLPHKADLGVWRYWVANQTVALDENGNAVQKSMSYWPCNDAEELRAML